MSVVNHIVEFANALANDGEEGPITITLPDRSFMALLGELAGLRHVGSGVDSSGAIRELRINVVSGAVVVRPDPSGKYYASASKGCVDSMPKPTVSVGWDDPVGFGTAQRDSLKLTITPSGVDRGTLGSLLDARREAALDHEPAVEAEWSDGNGGIRMVPHRKATASDNRAANREAAIAHVKEWIAGKREGVDCGLLEQLLGPGDVLVEIFCEAGAVRAGKGDLYWRRPRTDAERGKAT